MAFSDRLQHAWNAFMNKDPTPRFGGPSYSYQPHKLRLTRGNERSIVNSVYNRLSLDASSISIKHVKLDDEERYSETINSGLNNCLNIEANIDQTGRAFLQDIFLSLLDNGVVAIVPVLTSNDPSISQSYDIKEMRVGKIIEWKPKTVKVRLYNDTKGKDEEIWLLKKQVAIVENPFYSIMNAPNSTLQRLIRKLNILDVIDEQSGAGKLDLIIQLPYTIKTEARRQQADARRKDIELQLANSKYGIAYADSAERITQLNRSVDNNLMKQIEYLTSMLYSQLGLTQEIMNGSADPKTMTNYYNRTIEPIISAVVDEMKRKFLTKTARSQNQSIEFFRDPFKLLPIAEFAELADKLTRNEIMSSNEIRTKIGLRPSDDPKADELRNSNMPDNDPQPVDGLQPEESPNNVDAIMNMSNEELANLTEEYINNLSDEEFAALQKRLSM